MTIYEASRQYLSEGTPLLVLGGKEYGSGSSRDWAAKGTALLGVRAVLVESFERIHRSNLIGMGVLPLQFRPGESAASLGLTGHEVFDVAGIEAISSGPVPREVTVLARADGDPGDPGEGGREFRAVVRIDTPGEAEYFRHGGIMQFVLRTLLARN
jgi:aconitate hydratase